MAMRLAPTWEVVQFKSHGINLSCKNVTWMQFKVAPFGESLHLYIRVGSSKAWEYRPVPEIVYRSRE